MLKISLIAVGEKMPGWVSRGYQEYAKRIRGRAHLDLVEIPAGRRGKNADVARIIQTEEGKIREAVPGGPRLIALEHTGKPHSTPELSRKMQGWIDGGHRVAIVIGGPEGLSPGFIDSADETWSLSSLTLAHPLARVLVAEQLYRCHSMLEKGRPTTVNPVLA